MEDRKIVIDPPLKGEWAIMNPPGHAKLAFDFLAVSGDKYPYKQPDYFPLHLLSFISVSDTLAWAQPVYAPLDGVVVKCHDGTPDRERINMIYDLLRLMMSRPARGSPFSAYGGNYVLLKCGDIYVLLCHLKNGSLRVKAGDAVPMGNQLAEVGNSGLSLQPHLHLQVMADGNIFPLFRNLLPCALRKARLRVGREWVCKTNLLLRNGEHLLLDV